MNAGNAANATNVMNVVNIENPTNATNTMNEMNARGRLLTTQRWNKVARSRKSTDDESNFGDSGYEVTT